MNPAAARPWWESRPFVAAMVLLALVPLIYPPVPPLVDLPAHMGRYRVMLEGGNSPSLQQWYVFRWAVVGNLGVDLLVYPLGKLIGLEPAVKLIIMMIPPLTVAGFLWVAREVHGRIPPTAAFALPFAFGYPFTFGFVNFALSMAFAFLAFGLWLRLERKRRYRLRAILFVPISCLVWVTHTFGWGVLGLLAFSAETVHQHDRTRSWPQAVVNAGIQVLSLTPPLLMMAAWRSGGGGETGGWFSWPAKWQAFRAVLRDRWVLLDSLSMAVALFAFWAGFRHKSFELSRNLAASLVVLITIFLLLPRIIFGSAYADMRLMPCIFAIALLAIRERQRLPAKAEQLVAIVGIGFYLFRLAVATASFAIAADHQRAILGALDHIPRGARVASMAQLDCSNPWSMPRDDHLGSMVTVRREGFSNDQWQIAGINLMTVNYPAAGKFAEDPSQMIGSSCATRGWRDAAHGLSELPVEAFDFVWLINTPEPPREALRGAQLVWRGPDSLLYRLPSPSGAAKDRSVARTPPVDRRPLLQ